MSLIKNNEKENKIPKTLEKQCLENIASSIIQMPEMIIEKITDISLKEIRKEIVNEYMSEFKNQLYPIIHDILSDMIKCMRTNNIRQNYFIIYKNIDNKIIEFAINIANELLDNFGYFISVGMAYNEENTNYDSVMISEDESEDSLY